MAACRIYGLAPLELLGLRWQNVDLDAGRVLLGNADHCGQQFAFGEPKTARGKRNIALDG